MPIFELYVEPGKPLDGLLPSDYSLLDIANLEACEKTIYVSKFKFLSSNDDDERANEFKHVRVQKQVLQEGDETRVMITLIDNSAEVQCNKVSTEKLIMSMVNATVSHDIRNPLNSISCQNSVMKMLIERIGDECQKETLPPEFKATLRRIQKKMYASLDMNLSSEKIISFLVDDFLDLG